MQCPKCLNTNTRIMIFGFRYHGYKCDDCNTNFRSDLLMSDFYKEVDADIVAYDRLINRLNQFTEWFKTLPWKDQQHFRIICESPSAETLIKNLGEGEFKHMAYLNWKMAREHQLNQETNADEA